MLCNFFPISIFSLCSRQPKKKWNKNWCFPYIRKFEFISSATIAYNNMHFASEQNSFFGRMGCIIEGDEGQRRPFAKPIQFFISFQSQWRGVRFFFAIYQPPKYKREPVFFVLAFFAVFCDGNFNFFSFFNKRKNCICAKKSFFSYCLCSRSYVCLQLQQGLGWIESF